MRIFQGILQNIYKMSSKVVNPSAERNKDPILKVLQTLIAKDTVGDVLEISSGTGQHCAYFAPHFPKLTFQPSEYDVNMLPYIKQYIDDCPTKNIKQPLHIDVTTPSETWGVNGTFQYMLNINMIHISPIKCTQMLFANAGELLSPDGLLITYGPYAHYGTLEPSNVMFSKSLQSQNPEWGVRDIEDLEKFALTCGIKLRDMCKMPANNRCLFWEKI